MINLATISATLAKCSATPAAIRWRLAIRLVLDRKYVFELPNKETERPFVVFTRERPTRYFPTIPIVYFVD